MPIGFLKLLLLVVPLSLSHGAPAVAQSEPETEATSFQFGEFMHEVRGLGAPADAAIDPGGLIYVLESERGVVSILNEQGERLSEIGEEGSAAGQLLLPQAIALAEDELLIADTWNHRVVVFGTDGRFRRAWGERGTDPGRFNRPAGIAIVDDHIFVADTGNNRIQVFNREGVLQSTFGSAGDGDGEFRAPTDIAVDPEGNIHVVDSLNNRVQIFDAQGNFREAFGDWGPFIGLFDEPVAAVWNVNELIVVDQRNHRVQMIDASGEALDQWGTHELIPHEGEGKIHYPSALAIAPSQEFAVMCEPVEDRIQFFARKAEGAEAIPSPPPVPKSMQIHFGERASLDGNLLATIEPENHSIFIFDADAGEVPVRINVFGERGEKFGLLIRPSGIALDFENRRLLVSDLVNRRIQEYRLDYDPSEPLRFLPEMTTFARAIDFDVLERALAAPRPRWPLEIAAMRFGPNGLLYLLDSNNAELFTFDEQFQCVKRIGSYGSGDTQLRFPDDFAFTPDGSRVLVTDTLNERIQVYAIDGKHLTSFGESALHAPAGITVADDGSIYVSDAERNEILAFNAEHSLTSRFGQQGNAMGQFWNPRALAMYDDRLFVIDQGNHRAQILSPSGEWLVTFSGGRPYTRSNPPPQSNQQNEGDT